MDIHKDYFLPPEWYKQSGVMLTWPHKDTDWTLYLEEITDTYIKLTMYIARYEKVIIATPYVSDVKAKLLGCLSGEEMKNIIIVNTDSDDTWARDHGPITLVSKDEDKVCRMLDFRFNAWGEKFDYEKDNLINRNLYAAGAFNALFVGHDDFVLEGGSIESDGQGTIFTTSSCLLAPHRNQPLTREDIESCLREYLYAERIVWLNHGNLIGDDTDGHIDTIVRIAPDDTLLYVDYGNAVDEQYEDFLALEEELKNLRTMSGNGYRLLALPMPDAVYYDGERLPATYANFLVINGAVIVPVYGQSENDEKAKNVIGKAFPNRDIIGVDASVIVRQHGSIHCLTMQLPEGMLRN
nr:agmatine deiminase family protein [Prevotella sp.]